MNVLVAFLIFAGLSAARLHSYLLFHSLAELFSVVVACGIFVVAWHARRFLDNNYLLVLGIAYLFVGGLDVVHLLAYRGMGVFSGDTANLSVQLWIAARYLEAGSLLGAMVFLGRRVSAGPVFWAYGVVFSLVLVAVFSVDVFPVCYVAGVGLTPFKKISEYVVCMILLGTLGLLWRHRERFDARVWNLLAVSIAFTIASELAFTLYVHVEDVVNLFGHYLKLASFYLIYKALIETGLTEPYNLLFRDLKQSEESLRSVVETATDGIVSVDSEAKIVLWNHQAETMFGYTREDVLGESLEMIVPERFRHQHCTGIAAALTAGGPTLAGKTIELVGRRRDGSEFPLELSLANWTTREGTFFTGIIRDVTQQKRRAEEREITIELFRIIHSSDPWPHPVRELTGFLKRWAECDAVGLRLREGNDFPYFVTTGFTEEFVRDETRLCASFVADGSNRAADGGLSLECICGRVINGQVDRTWPEFTDYGSFWTNSTTDLINSAAGRELGDLRNRCNTEGYESVALIPLRSGDVSFGLLQLNAKRRGLFTEDRILLLERIADRIAGALAKRHAEEALAWESAIDAAMAELSQAVLQAVSPDDISDLVLEHARRLSGSPFGYVGYIDPDTGALVCPTLTKDVWEQCRVSDKSIVFKEFHGLWGWVLQHRQPLLTNTPAEDPRATGTPPGHIPIRRFVSAPAVIGGDLVGQVALANAERDYTQRDLHLVQRLADLYALGIQRAQTENLLRKARETLELRVQERTRELMGVNEHLRREIAGRRRLEKEVLDISAAEQRRIGRDLHDGLGQLLTGAAFISKHLADALTGKGLAEADDATEVMHLVGQAIKQARALATGLCPVALGAEGFMTAIRELASNVEDRFGVRCLFRYDQPLLIEDHVLATHLYYIAQEALNNAVKHGRGRHLSITLSSDHAEQARLEVTDNGAGLPENLDGTRGMGIHIMKYRAGMIGGTLDFLSAPGGGTIVRCVFRNEKQSPKPEQPGHVPSETE